MSATITVGRKSEINVLQTFSDGVSGNETVLFNGGMNIDTSYTSATSVPVTKFAEFEKTMSGGAGTIDLTALPGITADETVVGTGLKLQLLRIRNKSTNANAITVTKGASNGYGLNAAGASWTVVLDPGQAATFELNETAPNVAAGAKDIDISGTGSQILEVQIVLG